MDRPFDLQAYDRLEELARRGYTVIIEQCDDTLRPGKQIINVAVEDDDEEIQAMRLIAASSSPLFSSAVDAVYRFVMERQHDTR